jgi:adiponectin receptor
MASLTRQRKPIQMQINGESIPSYSGKIRSNTPANHPRLCSFDELPEWHQDNHFILHGYRPVSNSVRASWESWFHLHNETVNIFTHLIPAIYCLAAEGLITQYFAFHYPKSTNGDRIVFAFFILTVTICFGMSATYHTLMNHSDSVSHLWLRIDFVGIILHTLGNFISGIYVVFYCEPTLQKVYWTMVCNHIHSSTRLTVVWQDTRAGIDNCARDRESQISRETLENIPCLHLCRNRTLGVCPSNTWH